MRTFEEYKRALLEQPSPYLRERMLGEADKNGLTVMELDALAQTAALVWA